MEPLEVTIAETTYNALLKDVLRLERMCGQCEVPDAEVAALVRYVDEGGHYEPGWWCKIVERTTMKEVSDRVGPFVTWREALDAAFTEIDRRKVRA